MLAVAAVHAALPEGRGLDLERQGAGVSLRWLGITNAPYEAQARTNLVQGGWGLLGTVIGADGLTVYPVPPDDSPTRFFRVLFPQPTVLAAETARYVHGTGGSYLYITGDFFYSGDQVRVGGILANNTVLLTASLLRVELPSGLPPGRHDVEILSNNIGALMATLHEAVTVVDLATDPNGLLQGPPELPPASPTGLWMGKRGYDYYKAASDQAASASPGTDALTKSYLEKKLNKMTYVGPPDNGKGITERGLKLYDDSSASITVPDNGKGISQPGIKLFDDSSAMSAGFEVVDGKKGLNAVNVKLARMAGGANDNDSPIVSAVNEFMVEDFRYAVSHKLARMAGGGNIGSSGQDDVSLFSGDVQECVVDMAVPGRGLDFVWARTYHSRLGRTGSATNGWTFSYDLHVQPLGGDLLVHNGTGRADRYVLQTNGVYTCPEFFCEGTLNANVFRLTFADTGYWEFKPLGTAPEAGKLDHIVDRNGNTVSLSYDQAGRLSGLVDDLGRNYAVAYDTAGRLASVSDFSNRTVSYLYDGNGDLVACVSPPVTDTPNGNNFPNGKTNSYVYTSGSTTEAENHLLVACVDGLGQTTTQYGYDLAPASPSYLRCTSVQRGDHPPTMLTYQPQTPTPDNRFAALRCIVNDPVGNVTELLYDCRNRGIDKKDIRRRAEPGQPVTDTATLPPNKLRHDDPEYTVTRWTWNNDSLCTSATAPGGQVVRYTYQGDLEPSTPARKRADCRVVREVAASPVDLDGDGTPDTRERVWHYTYDPRFGADPSRKGWDGSVKGKRFGVGGETSPESPLGHSLRKGWDGSIKGGIVDYRDEDCDGDGFATSGTDPRGNVTIQEYDPHGNRTASIKQGHYSVSNFRSKSEGNYNSFGQLTSITNAPDANGYQRVDTFSYYENGPQTGYLQSIAIDEPGVHLTTAFEYDSRGNLNRCVDPRGNDWLYTYNSLDQCVRAQSPVNLSARCSAGFFYDASDNLVQRVTQVRNPNDALTGTCTNRASYDTLNRLTEVALAVDAAHALTNRFVYDGNDRCVQLLGGDAVSGVDPHHAVSFVYDTCGLLYREIAAPGSADPCTTQYDYDANGLVVRVSEGLEETPSVTTLAYDGFAETRDGEYEKWEGVLSAMGAKAKAWMVNNRTRVSQITDPMGNVTTFHHDANDNMTVARQFGQTLDAPGSDGNIRLAESRYEYDALDRCAVQRDLHFDPATQSPVGDGECTTAFAYAPNGACIGITNDLGGVTTTSYDTAGRVYSVRVPGDKSLRVCLRDAAGNVTSVTQTDTAALGGPPRSFTRTFAYDSRNRCVSSTDGVGKTTACAYDSLDRLVRSTDAAGTQTFHHYDLLGRCTAIVGDLDGDGLEDLDSDITQQASWSPSNGRLLSTTDSHGNTTSYAYDSRDRCVAVSCADGTQQSLVWSPRSNLDIEQDANGSVITNSYDLNDRLVARDIVANEAAGVSTATTFEVFTYDGCDRLSAHRDDDCDGDSAYDSLGHCVSESLNGLATTSTYDALGNRLSLTYPGGRVLAYAYDASGCGTNITEASRSLASFLYDGVDRLARVTYGNGLNSTFEYDGLDGVQNAPADYGFGQVSRMVHSSSNGSPVKISHLSWDLKSNKGARIIPPLGTGVSTNVLTLEYDRADRLVHSTVTEGTTTLRDTIYGLDRLGNRTNVTGAACDGPYTMDAFAPGSSDFQMNQYSSTPCDIRSYDDNGNLVSISSLATGALTLYTYDYADQLVSVSSVIDGGTGGMITNLVASNTYDALGRRASKTVYIPGEPTPTSRILRMVHDRDRVIEEREDEGVVQSYVLAGDRLIGLRIGNADYFVLADDQGNADLLTDASGAVVEGYDYDDYGAVTFLTSDGTPTSATSSTVGNPYCWGGLRFDAETGLHNDDGGVYFEPQVGRSVARRSARTGRNPQTGKTIKISASFNPWSSEPPSVTSKHYITIPHDRRVPGGSSGNNPWSGGTPLGMAKGSVKFFNTPKGFGRAANQQKLDSVLNLIR
jgi:YD repeat-containing protein